MKCAAVAARRARVATTTKANRIEFNGAARGSQIESHELRRPSRLRAEGLRLRAEGCGLQAAGSQLGGSSIGDIRERVGVAGEPLGRLFALLGFAVASSQRLASGGFVASQARNRRSTGERASEQEETRPIIVFARRFLFARLSYRQPQPTRRDDETTRRDGRLSRRSDANRAGAAIDPPAASSISAPINHAAARSRRRCSQALRSRPISEPVRRL